MYKLIKNNWEIILIFLLLLTIQSTYLVSSNENKTIVYASPYDIFPSDVFDVMSRITELWESSVLVGLYERSSETGYKYFPVLASAPPTIELLNKTETGYAMKLTVTLKDGLEFSDGTPITAQDVKYTYYMHLSPKLSSSSYKHLKYNFPSNDSIVVKDSKTIEFFFANQDAFFYSYLDIGIVPKHVYEQEILKNNFAFDKDPLKFILGAGPYKLISFEKTSKYSYTITLTINEHWVKTGFPAPKISTLVFEKITTREKAISEFNQRKVDILDMDYKILPEDYHNITHAKIVRIPGTSIYEVSLNHIHPVWGRTAQLDVFLNKTFSYENGDNYTVWSFWNRISKGSINETERIEASRLIRKAISYSIPRKELANYFYNFSVPTPTIIPRGSIIKDPELEPREYSIEKARNLIISAFKLAGWNNISSSPVDNPESTGKYFVGELYKYFPEWSLVLLGPITCASTIYSDTLKLLNNSLTQLGFHVKKMISSGWDVIAPRTFDFKISESLYNLSNGLHTPVPLFDEGGFDTLLVGYYYGLDWNTKGLFDTSSFLPHGMNFYNWWDPYYDEIINNYVTELNHEKRVEIGKQIDDYFYSQQPSIPLLNNVLVWAYYEGITGIDLTLLSFSTPEWWKIDKNSEIYTSIPTTQKWLYLEFFSLLFGLIGIVAIKKIKNRR